MSLTNVLISILGKKREVCRRDDFSENGLGPLFTRLVLVLDLKVLRYESWSCLHYFYDLVL